MPENLSENRPSQFERLGNAAAATGVRIGSKNPILEELYAIRSQIQAEHGDHLSAYLHGEFERLKAGGHPVAQIEQRAIRCREAMKSGALATKSRSSPTGDR